jgi:hypothetical protein
VVALQRGSTSISEVAEAVSGKAAEAFDNVYPNERYLSSSDLEKIFGMKPQELVLKIENLERENEQLKLEQRCTAAASQLEKTNLSVNDLKKDIGLKAQTTSLQLEAIGENMKTLRIEIKNLSTKHQEKELNDRAELESLGLQLDETRQAGTKQGDAVKNLVDLSKKLKDDLDFLSDKYQEREHDEEVEEPDEDEPGIALEDQLRITEQSAKAIDLLSSHLLSTVWQTCSRNTFGKCSLALFTST